MHIVFRSHKTYNQESIKNIKDFFFQEGINSITVQPEFSDATKEHVDDRRFAGMIENEDDCLLVCAERKCAYLTCCETPKKILAKLREEH